MNRIAINAILGGDPLLTPEEVAALFRVNKKTVSRWTATGHLPACRTPGGRLRYRESVVSARLTPPQ